MKVKLLDLWSARFAFIKIFNSQFDDAKLSYILSKIAKKINSELEDIDKERLKIVEKYADKDERGKNKITSDNRILLKDNEAFNKEWLDFLETEIELDVWLIPWKAIEIVKPIPNEMIALEKFMEEPKEEKK